MKLDKEKLVELIRGICAVESIDYYNFIRPSKEPNICQVRSIFINYLVDCGLYYHEIGKIVNLDRTNVSRNNKRAIEVHLKYSKGKQIRKHINILVFRQSIGVDTIFNQIIRERVLRKKKSRSRAFMGQIENL